MGKNILIGTAGHIDHGKSTLIKALTGDETDRLAAEKTRGISIENGFSNLETKKTVSEKLNLGIIDVPGHEKFVNKMLSAAAGVDLALIVVAADEGVMPQTKEHLAILNLLGVKKAIIALTKIDLVDQEWIQLVEADIKDHLENSFAENADIVRVSSIENIGIDRLENLIINTALKMVKEQKSAITYFPIDRVFSLKGFGTVVTGSLFSGQLNVGDELSLYPSEKKVKIRSLESHGTEKDQVESGSRVGLNLSGIEKSAIKRGDLIASPNSLLKSKFFEGELKLLKSINFTVKNGDQIHFHTAALETTGRVYLYNRKEAFPGEKVYIKLILEEEVALFFKQKFILRRSSPLTTIGGGEILEIDPPPRRKADKSKISENLNQFKKASIFKVIELLIKQQQTTSAKIEILKKKSTLKAEKLEEILHKLAEAEKIVELTTKKTYIHQSRLEKLEKNILKIISNYHQNFSLRPGIKKEEIRSQLDFKLNKKELDSLIEILSNKKMIKDNNNLIAIYDFEIRLSSKMEELKKDIIKSYQENLFSPPTRKEIIDNYQIEEDFFSYLENEGFLIRLTVELYFHQSVLIEARELIINYFRKNESLNLAEFRNLIKSSRRYALPLLEKMDHLKITSRDVDLRYPGEKLEI